MKKPPLLLQFVLLAFALQQSAPPIFNPPAGTYPHALVVEMMSTPSGADIHYTANGDTPTLGSPLYTAPLALTRHASANHDPDPNDSTTPVTTYSYRLSAIAAPSGISASPVVTGDYLIDRVESYLNLAYADPPDGDCANKHLLDVYRPRGQSNTPVLFFVHGGAWTTGDKNMYLELGNMFAGDYQMTTVVINYRLTNPECSARHPDHVKDVALAFQWVVEHIASYGGDPGNIHLFGQSAGGHLVSLLAADSTYLGALGISTDQIQSVTSMSGAYNLADFIVETNNPLGLSAIDVAAYRAMVVLVFGNLLPQNLLDASPGYHADATMPPFHLINLTESANFHDMPGFSQDAAAFQAQLTALAGSPVSTSSIAEADIPPAVLALDFPNFTADIDGHYEEIYAINTLTWDSRSSELTAAYVKSRLPLQLTWPNGGESLPPATARQITWNDRSGLPAVRLEYSLDDGETWNLITDSTPNNGSYEWQTPLTQSWLARVRISAAGSGLLADQSTQVFAIGPIERFFLPLVLR